MAEFSHQSACNSPTSGNDGKITLLPRDPHCLYAYWDLIDRFQEQFIKEFGDNCWSQSMPALKVTNVSKNEVSFIELRSDSRYCYINVKDASCLYTAELGIKTADGEFIPLIASNYTCTPSSIESSDSNAYFIDYRDLKKGMTGTGKNRAYSKNRYFCESSFINGLSSPEVVKTHWETIDLDTVPNDLLAPYIHEHLNVSSDSFFRKD